MILGLPTLVPMKNINYFVIRCNLSVLSTV